MTAADEDDPLAPAFATEAQAAAYLGETDASALSASPARHGPAVRLTRRPGPIPDRRTFSVGEESAALYLPRRSLRRRSATRPRRRTATGATARARKTRWDKHQDAAQPTTLETERAAPSRGAPQT